MSTPSELTPEERLDCHMQREAIVGSAAWRVAQMRSQKCSHLAQPPASPSPLYAFDCTYCVTEWMQAALDTDPRTSQ